MPSMEELAWGECVCVGGGLCHWTWQGDGGMGWVVGETVGPSHQVLYALIGSIEGHRPAPRWLNHRDPPCRHQMLPSLQPSPCNIFVIGDSWDLTACNS
ncbi:hypothetical protein RRG08_000448 [Elysia crispata]|uniref:Uncharacterized protein n=1 Tax=Elysia crispata TaxID=231223 RepID=A0AAE0YC09_9GAST|nr:hypothetical protein RRG08_000448 [Elysia crispata]